MSLALNIQPKTVDYKPFQRISGLIQPQNGAARRFHVLREHLHGCDGQALYKADIVDAIVLEVIQEMFAQLKAKPRDKTVENRMKRNRIEEREKRNILEKNIQAAQHNLESYENEIINVLNGVGRFSEAVLSRMISKTEQEIDDLKLEYARLVTSAEEKAPQLKKIEQYYNAFLGWANEFETATLQRKRMILSELIDRVEIGSNYKVTIKFNLSYSQLLDMAGKAGVEIQNSDEVA